jgi:hypothetical protein
MKISLNKNQKINQIQQEFNSFFPYLKIEFFNSLHKIGDVTANKFMIENNKIIGEYIKNGDIENMAIDPKMTVSNFEENFKKLGIGVQVYRKSGNLWLETGATDSWTLEVQNQEGESITNQYN